MDKADGQTDRKTGTCPENKLQDLLLSSLPIYVLPDREIETKSLSAKLLPVMKGHQELRQTYVPL